MPEMGLPVQPQPHTSPSSPQAVALTHTWTPGMRFGAENAQGQPGLSEPPCALLRTGLSGWGRDVPTERGTCLASAELGVAPKCAEPPSGRYCSGNHFYTTYVSDRPAALKCGLTAWQLEQLIWSQ